MARLFPRLSRDSKMTCPMSHPPSPETLWFVIKNGAGPQAQLQKDKSNAFSLRMKLVHGSSFRMIAQLRFSGRTGGARLDARVRRVGVCRACRANGPGRAGAGQGGPGGPGRARLGAIIRIVQYFWFFGPIAQNTTRVQIIGQIGLQRGKHQNICIFGKRSILSNNFGSEKQQ